MKSNDLTPFDLYVGQGLANISSAYFPWAGQASTIDRTQLQLLTPEGPEGWRLNTACLALG